MIESKKELNTTNIINRLNKLAYNLWWSWHPEVLNIFLGISPALWEKVQHNPVAFLKRISTQELTARLFDRQFYEYVLNVLEEFESYINEKNTWGAINFPHLQTHPIAYFCAEFGLHESLPIAAGGLGMLAADHIRSASDLGIGLVGVSLFYREGYFMQAIDYNGWQIDYYSRLNPDELPLEPVLDKDGKRLIISIPIDLSKVYIQAWRINVGRNFIILLDSCLPENEQRFRELTYRLYSGDSSVRIMQEMLLGIGGIRMLRAMDISPSVYHMNEGHSAFLTIELLREELLKEANLNNAIERVRQKCVFTTHTPVEAGHDYFDKGLFQYAFGRYLNETNLSLDQIYRLGQVYPDQPNERFCTTVLAIRMSRKTNAVSELHGRISRSMWRKLFPQANSDDEVPIIHITNGIHIPAWLHPILYLALKDKLQTSLHSSRPLLWNDWTKELKRPEFWKRLADPEFIADEELWALRYKLRRRLVDFVRERLFKQNQRLGQAAWGDPDQVLNPDHLTIGFARRFAVYKRPYLLFKYLDRVIALALDEKRPVQFIFAGKAHPHDEPAKQLLQYIINLCWHSPLRGRIAFLENYDMLIARELVAGCDIWLNNPRRPLEASGTSGMKAAINGTLNMSIMDGWWREAFDGTNGFAIGGDWNPPNIEEQDKIDADNLFKVLSEEVIPTFYDRDKDGIPRRWINKIRAAFASIPERFNTDYMLLQYLQLVYIQQ